MKHLRRTLLGAVVLLLALYFFWPRRPVGRFVPIDGTPNLALDTRAGILCWSYDPLNGGNGRVPLCKDVR